MTSFVKLLEDDYAAMTYLSKVGVFGNLVADGSGWRRFNRCCRVLKTLWREQVAQLCLYCLTLPILPNSVRLSPCCAAFGLQGIESGTIPFRLWSKGQSFWDHLSQNERHAATFDVGMLQVGVSAVHSRAGFSAIALTRLAAVVAGQQF
jgi:hypothetical protein